MKMLTDEEIENLANTELNRYCSEGIQPPDKRGIIDNHSSDIKHALALVEFVKSKGFWCQLKTPFEPNRPDNLSVYTCGFTPAGVTGWNGRPDHFATGSTMEIAICKAFLRWQRDYKEGNLTNRKYYEDK